MKWILLLIFLPLMVWGQDGAEEVQTEKTLLVINPFTSTFDHNELEKSQINKIILKACTRQQIYQIALGELGDAKKAKFDIHHVQLEITKDGNGGASIKGVLIDEKNKKLINKIVEIAKEKNDLLRKVEEVMNRLFGKMVEIKDEDEGKKKPKNRSLLQMW